MLSLFNCRKKAVSGQDKSRAEMKSDPGASPISKLLNPSLGAHINSFLSGTDALKAKATSKQLCHWDDDKRNNHIWREHLKNDFDCHENFVSQLSNAKQVYLRLYHFKKNNPRHLRDILFSADLEYFILRSGLGNTKHPEYSDQISKEKNEAYLLNALIVGNVELARRLLSKDPKVSTWNIASAACLGGHKDTLRWIIDESRYHNYHDNLLRIAARSGDLHLVQSLITEASVAKLRLMCSLSYTAKGLYKEAIKSGNLTLVLWLKTKAPKAFRYTPKFSDLTDAAQSGNLNLFRWLMLDTTRNALNCRWSMEKSELERLWKERLENASSAGNFKLVIFISKHMPKEIELSDDFEDFVFRAAQKSASSGNKMLTHWWMLQLSQTYKYPLFLSHILDAAVSSENIELVKWLINPTGKWQIVPTTTTLNNAAETGNIALVQSILEAPNFDFYPDFKTLISAVKSRNFALIEWLASPERGDRQLKISEKVIIDARQEYISWQKTYGLKISALTAQITRDLLTRALTLAPVAAEHSFGYKSP
ncbi:MAG: hypothetical protein ACYCQI_12380 [Gammaproteobacteria bacterium]